MRIAQALLVGLCVVGVAAAAFAALRADQSARSVAAAAREVRAGAKEFADAKREIIDALTPPEEAQAVTRRSPPAARQAVRVSRVVDGDTVDVGEVRYRIAELDAPELRGARCQAERFLGEHARARLEALIAGARVVEVAPTGEVHEARRGYPERLFARLYVDGQDVNDVLIREHLAQPWRDGPGWCNGLG